MAEFGKAWNNHKKLPSYDHDEFLNADFKPVWKGTKQFEGGYQAMPNDTANYCPAKGKPGSQLIGTNHGISAIGMASYIKRCPSVAEMKGLSESKAMEIAKKQYWDPIQADSIRSQAVAHLIFDSTYGSGSYGPLQVRQTINKIKGPGTVKEAKTFTLTSPEIDLINKIPEKQFFTELYNRRVQFFKGMTFEKGLTNRVNKLKDMYMQGVDMALKATKRHWVPLILISGLIATGLYFALRKK
jgi:lysozyme family protein